MKQTSFPHLSFHQHPSHTLRSCPLLPGETSCIPPHLKIIWRQTIALEENGVVCHLSVGVDLDKWRLPGRVHQRIRRDGIPFTNSRPHAQAGRPCIAPLGQAPTWSERKVVLKGQYINWTVPAWWIKWTPSKSTYSLWCYLWLMWMSFL